MASTPAERGSGWASGWPAFIGIGLFPLGQDEYRKHTQVTPSRSPSGPPKHLELTREP